MPHRKLLLGFALKIMLPAIVATAGIAAVMLSLLNSIFNEANSLDKGYTNRAARAAMSATLERMEGMITDNALWDDAVRYSYGKIDQNWATENWGVGTGIGLYNTAFIVDQNGDTLIGFDRGKKLDMSAKDYLGSGYEEFLNILPSDGKTFGKTSAIFSGKAGPVAAGAGVILPTSENLKLPQPKPNRLILIKALDADMLAGLAKQYTFDDLRLLPPHAAAPDGLEIANSKGEAVGTLAWTSRRPGDIARLKFADSAKVMIGTLLLVMGSLIYTTWKNYKGTYESEERAHYYALHDELSGLPNRRMLLQKLNEALTRPAAEKKSLALVYADLDGFKDVNDSYGHQVGDQLIRAVAAGFSQLTANKGLAARLGGDEFAIMVQGPNAAAIAQELSKSMTAVVSEPFNFGTCAVSVGVSIGVVESAEDITDADELLRRADRAMYIAKTERRNVACIYDAAMDQEREERRAIAGLLRDALKAESLRVVYQPIIDAKSRVVSGVEALLRWPINGDAEVPPDVFIAVAEEFGLIDAVGRFVLMRACRDAAGWPQLKLSVNVSPAQLKNPEFAYEVSQILNMTGLPAKRLELEVTESSIIEHPRRTGILFSKLHGLGVSIALDDFGAGFSGIGHLRQFKFDRLKIDKSLIKDIVTSGQALRLMQAATAMADSLSLQITAEGVELEDQVTLLKLAGCTHFQGALFSSPLEASAISASLAHKDQRQVA